MRIIIDNPPNIDKIKSTFKLTGREIFSWGDIIYNPSNVYIGPELIAHEAVHEKQQTTDSEKINAWWDRYLVDTKFRFEQELEAHRVEYRTFCKINKDRNIQTKYLTQISIRLASAIYGNMVSVLQAKKEITK